jgi:hypothetical protein
MPAPSRSIFGQGQRAAAPLPPTVQQRKAGTKVFLNPSRVSEYERCPRSYWFKYELKASSDEDGVALVFGSAIDGAVEGYLNALDQGKTFNIEADFEARWQKAIDNTVVKLNKTWTEQEFRASGKLLASRFPGAWEQSGLTVLSDPQGKLLTQLYVPDFDLGQGVSLRLKPDLIAVNAAGEVEVPDIKTAAQRATHEFAVNSDQLVMYQIVIDGVAPSLGIEQVDAMRFFEGIKKKVPTKNKGEGPVWHVGDRVDRKPQSVVQELKSKLYDLASDIRRRRFPKTPGMAFDSPCKMCSFASVCTGESWSGIAIPKDRLHLLNEVPNLPEYTPSDSDE